MNPATFQSISRHLDSGQPEQARVLLLQVLRTTPKDADANNLMAVALIRTGKPEAALSFAERALEAAPHATSVRENLANLLLTLDRASDAEDHFRRVLTAAPRPTAAAGLAAALAHQRRFIESAEVSTSALSHFPGFPPLILQAAGALLNSGKANDAVHLLDNALTANPADPIYARRKAAAMLYAPNYTPTQVADAHFEAGRLITAAVAEARCPLFTNTRDPNRKIRLAILSSDLRSHPVAHFAIPLFEHIDRSRFELTAYHDAGVSDATTKHLRTLTSRWIDSSAMSDAALAAHIRADNIDILFELSGYTSRPRGQTLALKPAPVIVSWLGYPSTLGLPAIDARIVDSLTDPIGPAEALHTEKLIRIDPCFLCYTPRTKPVPKSPRDHIVFASFNTFQKVNDPLLRLWSRILAAVPNSRLLIKSGGLEDPRLQHDARTRAAAHGIDPTRLDLLGHLPSQSNHLAAYARADIALDTFPYHGTTTTCEALSMGVPVISLTGSAHVSRVGLSLLTAVGHPEWCATDEDAYVTTAATLAHNPTHLATLRESLPAQLAASPLCDQQAFVSRLSSTLEGLWAAWTQT